MLPGLWLGMSEHHLPFGGTISIDFDAYQAILRSVVRSLKALGFARLLIVNGHGGHIDPLAVAARELAVAYDMPIVATTPWMLAPNDVAAIFETDTGPRHACEGETSVMLAIAGDIVKPEKFEEAMQQAPERVSAPAGFSRFYSFAERAPVIGTWGDPRKASKDKASASSPSKPESLQLRSPTRRYGQGQTRSGEVGEARSRLPVASGSVTTLAVSEHRDQLRTRSGG